ncbi:hypothetical protein MFIFM68171_04889 [Madurella fahalii]|uniref:Uncharacterized protein n=1 Tax=Madurella fahalii TaxID=1157608 RepID=A0ABQ0GAA8_9PEZI
MRTRGGGGDWEPDYTSFTLWFKDTDHLGTAIWNVAEVKVREDQWQHFTEEDCYILAITLAASFLQLYTTPWIGDRWSERIFSSARRCPKITNVTSTRIDVQHPFVTKTYRKVVGTTFTITLPSGTTIYSAAAGAFGSSTRDDSVNLLTLAKILMEIRSNHRIEDSRRSEDLGPHSLPNEATDLQMLKRWMV